MRDATSAQVRGGLSVWSPFVRISKNRIPLNHRSNLSARFLIWLYQRATTQSCVKIKVMQLLHLTPPIPHTLWWKSQRRLFILVRVWANPAMHVVFLFFQEENIRHIHTGCLVISLFCVCVCLQSGRTPASSALDLENTFKVTSKQQPLQQRRKSLHT